MRAELAALYQREMSEASSKSGRAKLASRLVESAEASADDVAYQYVLLRAAEKLAIQAEDVELSLEISTSIASAFAISEHKARTETLLKWASIRRPLPHDSRRLLANESLALVEFIVAEGFTTDAKALCNFAE
ncbi:hypothetical protein [Pirellulimonas nuda]|uniref:hypothetical protein n=1 Tax=Pirellulimonas nuda TaxID=2528009 RepID=UPI0011A0ACD4|nr:hypothetical protein [Pirellulimonas nuda]